jgi:hypothetical protein
LLLLKTKPSCFLYAFEMTGILHLEQEAPNKIQYISVFPSHTTDTLVAYRAKTDQSSV